MFGQPIYIPGLTKARADTLYLRAISGSVTSGYIGNNAVNTNNISSGAVTSGKLGVTGTPDGTKFLRDDFTWTAASFSLVSGQVTSGFLGDASVVSGSIASGQISWAHLSSGAVRSGHIADDAVNTNNVASGAITSGKLGVTGTPNGTQFLRDDFTWAIPTSSLTSGQVTSGYIGDAAVNSGNIASGAIGWPHLSSGAVISGDIGDGAVVSGSIASGQIWSDHIANGAIQYYNIANQAIRTESFDPAAVCPFSQHLTNIGVTAENISGGRPVAINSSGKLVLAMAGMSGRMPAVGIVYNNYLSGATATFYTDGPILDNVHFNFSGYLGSVLYVSTSGDLTPIQPSSGVQAIGLVETTTQVYLAQPLSLIAGSGISFDQINGGTLINAAAVTLTSGEVTSGFIGDNAVNGNNITAGSIDTNHFAAGAIVPRTREVISIARPTAEAISGGRAVTFNQSAELVIAMAGSSGRFPAIGLTNNNYASGDFATFELNGYVSDPSTFSYSGFVGSVIYTGLSGEIVTTPPAVSGNATQAIGIVADRVSVYALLQPFGLIPGTNVTFNKLAGGTVINATTFSLTSGVITSGYIGDGAVVSGSVASGQISWAHLSSGAVRSGHIANAAVTSGNIASGAVGHPHISSGAITSGQLGVTGTPDGTKFLRDDFTWAAASFSLNSGQVTSGFLGDASVVSGSIASGQVSWAHLSSGAVRSGHIANAAVNSGNVASGQISWAHLSSGAVRSGHVGDGAVVSGSIASGQIYTPHIASGTVVTFANDLQDSSFTMWGQTSGGNAVMVNNSGFLTNYDPTATGSGFLVAGISENNATSGQNVTLRFAGKYTSVNYDFSGYIGMKLYAGLSGQITAIPPSSSGNVQQRVGTAISQSGMLIRIDNQAITIAM